jgi:hypothetical protein
LLRTETCLLWLRLVQHNLLLLLPAAVAALPRVASGARVRSNHAPACTTASFCAAERARLLDTSQATSSASGAPCRVTTAIHASATGASVTFAIKRATSLNMMLTAAQKHRVRCRCQYYHSPGKLPNSCQTPSSQPSAAAFQAAYTAHKCVLGKAATLMARQLQNDAIILEKCASPSAMCSIPPGEPSIRHRIRHTKGL